VRDLQFEILLSGDSVILSGFARVITLDGDLLFFRKPAELLESTGNHIFQQDQASTYLVEQAAGVHVDPATLVVRHYAGPTRALMTEEGMPWLSERGFLDS
jgi:hypothetical protein